MDYDIKQVWHDNRSQPDRTTLTWLGEVISGIAASAEYFRTSGPPNSNTWIAFMMRLVACKTPLRYPAPSRGLIVLARAGGRGGASEAKPISGLSFIRHWIKKQLPHIRIRSVQFIMHHWLSSTHLDGKNKMASDFLASFLVQKLFARKNVFCHNLSFLPIMT